MISVLAQDLLVLYPRGCSSRQHHLFGLAWVFERQYLDAADTGSSAGAESVAQGWRSGG
jgi:hypothetical protein